MECRFKQVEFDRYCETCAYKECDEHLDPCDSCLAEPFNEHSRRPINYKAIEMSARELVELVRASTGCTTYIAKKALDNNSNNLQKAIDSIINNRITPTNKNIVDNISDMILNKDLEIKIDMNLSQDDLVSNINAASIK